MLCWRRRLKNWGISHWKHWLWKTLPDFYWMLISLKNILYNVMKGHTVSARYYILTRLKRMIINFWSVINPFINSNTGWAFYNVSFWIRVIFRWSFSIKKMKVILFISFFISINSKSAGESTLAESIETQKQRMKGLKLTWF